MAELRPDRLAAICALGPLQLAITARRAETLKARAYDGDLFQDLLDRERAAGTRIIAETEHFTVFVPAAAGRFFRSFARLRQKNQKILKLRLTGTIHVADEKHLIADTFKHDDLRAKAFEYFIPAFDGILSNSISSHLFSDINLSRILIFFLRKESIFLYSL